MDYELFEQDKIITFHTQDCGMLKVVVKGARKIKSRFAAVVQFPCYIDMVVYRKELSRMGILTDCGIRYLFPNIRNDIVRFAYASYVAEILLSSLKEGEANEGMFYLLLRVLLFLEQGKRENFELLVTSFKLKLLHMLGYTPELRRCVECGKSRDSFQSFYFTSGGGGILCEDCQRIDVQVIGVPKFVVLTMDYLLRSGIEHSFKPHIRKIERHITYLLDAYFLYHIDHKKHNARILINQLEKLG